MPRNIIMGETFFFLNFCIFWAKSRISYTWSPQWVISLEKSVSERGVQWNQIKKLCLETSSWEELFLKFFCFFWAFLHLEVQTLCRKVGLQVYPSTWSVLNYLRQRKSCNMQLSDYGSRETIYCSSFHPIIYHNWFKNGPK